MSKGRFREAARVREVRRAVAVGRLMLGEFSRWEDFLEADTTDFEALPRRELKQLKGASDRVLRGELKRFCNENFESMTPTILSGMYEDLKSKRGMNVPLGQFEARYSMLRPSIYKRRPRHSTVSLTLWGMQFEYPEHHLCKDVVGALASARNAESILEPFRELSHEELVTSRPAVARAVREEQRNSRACILSCFNLVECFLNGLAWEFLRAEAAQQLSKRARKTLEDVGGVSMRDKLVKYPQIIAGTDLWTDADEPVRTLLEDVRPYRDSIVHPSPFSAPQQFGGYDKLKNIYSMRCEIAVIAANTTLEIVERIHNHTSSDPEPEWISDLREGLTGTTDAVA